MDQFENFFQLHHNNTPLLIGNVWDVTSAKVFEQNGFKAIATSSRAMAHSMGYEDGENIPFDLLLQTVKRIVNNTSIPFSVDMEGGYSRSIPVICQNIEALYDLGVVGFNIEDSVMHEKGKLQAVSDFQKIISSVMNHLERKNMRMFLNARTDAFLHRLPAALSETISRAMAYEAAGASGIFVPFIHDAGEIKTIVNATPLPLNVLCTPQLPSFKELSDLGVKRISMGGTVHNATTKSIEKILQAILEDQSPRHLF